MTLENIEPDEDEEEEKGGESGLLDIKANSSSQN